MPVFTINQPITTKVPTVTVNNSFTAGSSHTFRLVVVNDAGIQSDPVQVTVQVAAVLLASPVMVAPPASQAATKAIPAAKVEPASTIAQPAVAKATPPKAPARSGVTGKPSDKAPKTPLERETVTPVQVETAKRKHPKPADQADVAKADAPEAPPKSSLTGKRRRPTAKPSVTPEEAKPLKRAPAEAEQAKLRSAEAERARKKSTRTAAKKSTRKKSS